MTKDTTIFNKKSLKRFVMDNIYSHKNFGRLSDPTIHFVKEFVLGPLETCEDSKIPRLSRQAQKLVRMLDQM